MTKRVDRFSMLEAPRTEPPEAGAPRVSNRFAAVEAAAPAEPQVDTPRDHGRKQLRCAECGRENGRYAGTCTKCRSPLDTRATRRLNERLFQDEQQVAAPAVVVEDEAPPARRLIDQLADRVGNASWSRSQRRAAVLFGAGAALGLVYLITGWPVVGFAVAVVVTIAVFLIPG